MSPDTQKRIRELLFDASQSLYYVDQIAHPKPALVGYGVRRQLAEQCAEMAEALRGDPSAMPEPWPGMVVLVAGVGGIRAGVEAVTSFLDGERGVYLARMRDVVRWNAASIAEVHSEKGRLLWRSS
jgi:hypothetical protein